MLAEANVQNVALQIAGSKVLLLADWENIFYGLYTPSNPSKSINFEHCFQGLMKWVLRELGELLDEHGFIFAPEHFTPHHRRMCVRNQLRIMICPKKKSGQKGIKKEEDTVDETIIQFGKMMLKHPEVKFLCLVSGDEDFIPLLEEAQKRGIKIALVPPTLNSLSASKKIIKFIDNHPKTGKKMVLRLDQV